MSGKVFEYFCNLLKIGDGDNFDYYFADVTRMLRKFGLDSWSPDYKAEKVAKSAFLVLFGSYYVFEVFFVLMYRDDYDLLIQALFVAVPSAMYLIKFLMMFINRKKLAALTNQIRNEFWSVEEDEADS